MAVTNADILRVFDTPSNLSLDLKAGMFGYDTTNDRLAIKRLADSQMMYISDDTQQCLLAGAQTVAGVKTFSSFPVTPSSAPTTDYQVANKKYVDDSSGASVWDRTGTAISPVNAGDYVLMNTNEEINFRSTSNRIWSDSANELTLSAGSEIVLKVATEVQGTFTSLGNVTIGAGVASTDYTLTFNGDTSDFVWTWMENESYLLADSALMMATDKKINFYDTGAYIQATASEVLSIYAGDELVLNGYNEFDISGGVGTITTSGAAGLEIEGVVWMDTTLGIGTTSAEGSGLTIDQATDDDIIISLKSTGDISQPMTDFAEASTYGYIKKARADIGGLRVVGLTDGNYNVGALELHGYHADSSRTPVVINSAVSDGAGNVEDCTLDILEIQNNGSVVTHIDAVGTITLGDGVETSTLGIHFAGTPGDGAILWKPTLGYFECDDILLTSDDKLYFRDTDVSIHSPSTGNIQITGNIDIGTNPIGYDGSAGGLSFDASNNGTFSDDLTVTDSLVVDTNTLVVNASGYTDKVGIGTATPQRTLQIEDNQPIMRLSDSNASTDAQVVSYFEFYRGNNTNRVGYFGYDSDTNEDITLINETSGGDVYLKTNDTTLSIGSSSHTAPLHLEANIPIFRLSDSNASTDAQVVSYFEFYRGNSTNRVGYFGYGSDTNEDITLINETSSGLINIGTNSTNRISIQQDGSIDLSDNPIGYDGSAGGLSFDSSNNATFTDNIILESEFICDSAGRSDVGTGSSNLTNARAAQDSADGLTRIIVQPTGTGTNDYYSFSNLVDGQRIIVINNAGCVPALIDLDPIDKSDTILYTLGATEAYEGVEFIYDSTIGYLIPLVKP